MTPRQMNALSSAAGAARRWPSGVGRRFMADAPAGVRLPRGGRQRPAASAPARRTSRRSSATSSPGRSSRWTSTRRVRRCGRCLGCAAWRCAGSGRSGSRSPSRSTRRSRAGTTRRWSTSKARCSPRPTAASCRRSPAPTGASAEVAAAVSRVVGAAWRRWRSRSSASRCRRAAAGSCATRGNVGPLQIELGRDEPAARLQRFVAVHGRTLGALERAGTPDRARRPALPQRVRRPGAGISRQTGQEGTGLKAGCRATEGW